MFTLSSRSIAADVSVVAVVLVVLAATIPATQCRSLAMTGPVTGSSSILPEDTIASALLAEAQPSKLLAVLDPSSERRSSDGDDAHRQTRRVRRQSPRQYYGGQPSVQDYYNNYYNDYYSQYYNGGANGARPAQQQQQQAYPAYRPASADRFDGNGNALDSGNNGNGFASDGRPQQQVINGQKYVYTPLFQYKATQGHHQKLFVPNLFG